MMTKRLLILSLSAISIFALVGCGKNTNTSITSETTINSSSESEQTSQSVDEFVVDDNTVYEATSWDEKADAMVKYALGDAYELIPHYSSTKITFSTEVGVMSDNSEYRISIIEFHPVSTKAAEDYETLIDDANYIYSDSYECYLLKASKTDDLHLIFDLVTKQGHKALKIQAARFQTRMENWEPSFSQVVIGFDIPTLEAESYEYYCDYGPESSYPYGYYFKAYCTGYKVENQNYLVTYKNAVLATNKWDFTTDDSYGYEFTSKDGYHTMLIYLELDCYNQLCLSMVLESEWPLFFLLSIIGEDLPKLQSNLGELYYYGIFTTGSTSYFGIYYTVDSVNAYNAYVASMGKYGYSIGSPEDQGSYVSEDESIGTVHYSYMAKTFSDGEQEVSVLYSEGQGQLAIIIF